MKLQNGESLEVGADNDSVPEGLVVKEESYSRYYCPTCTTVMIPLSDNSVQCDLLSEKNGLLAIASEINTGSRRGSVQSMTEVQEEVSHKDEVATLEAATSPNEILIMTRSFENQASPVPVRRSSIAVLFDGIKSLGSRRRSDPTRKPNELDQVAEQQSPKTTAEEGPSKLDVDRSKHRASFSDEIESAGKDIRRKSFQLDNGTLVEEESAVYDAGLAITTDEASPPGAVNFISRSFETVHECPQTRRESIIDKLNFFKMIPKIGKSNDAEKKEEVPEWHSDVVVGSGVRRKSLAPSFFQSSLVEEEEEDCEEKENKEDARMSIKEYNEDPATDNDLFCPNKSRYVTSGIRRGSVAAVSAAPPFLALASKQNEETQLTPPGADSCQNVRYVENGIRRGSIAGVSAAPPCKRADSEADDQIMSNTELQIEDPGTLRSGIRRRSLTPANEQYETEPQESPPKAAKRVAFDGPSSMNSMSDDEDACEEADEFMERVNERYEKKKNSKQEEKKGAVGLFESLTGRKYGVDYASIDARLIQEKLDEEYDEKQAQLSIPTITFSEDPSEDKGNNKLNEDPVNSEGEISAENQREPSEINTNKNDSLCNRTNDEN